MPERQARHLVFVQSGTGIYSTASGAVGAVALRALDRDGFALLTMDKPGISVDPRGALVFDREAYRRYTLPDLVTCGRNALRWVRSRGAVAPLGSLVLHGHSEGGQVIVGMLAAPASSFPFERIERTIVTGLPLEPFLSAAERQIASFMPFEIEAFHDAVEHHDDEYLLQHGLSSAYLAHPSARRGFASVLTALANERPNFPVELFHGDRDLNAPLDRVKQFVAQNSSARNVGRPALDLRLHVYAGARHYLDRRFDADMDAMLGAIRE